MKYLMPLALILGFGCTNYAMRAEHTTAELDRLPGRSDPVRVTCRDQSEGAPGRLPIQLRSETRPARGGGRVRGLHGRAECLRLRGDGQRGYHRRRTGVRPEPVGGPGFRIAHRHLAMSTTRLGRPCGFRKMASAGWTSTSSTRRPRHGTTIGWSAATGCWGRSQRRALNPAGHITSGGWAGGEAVFRCLESPVRLLPPVTLLVGQLPVSPVSWLCPAIPDLSSGRMRSRDSSAECHNTLWHTAILSLSETP